MPVSSPAPTICPTSLPAGVVLQPVFANSVEVNDDALLRMVGKGSLSSTSGAGTASYAYILNCNEARNASAPFEVRFSGRRFRLTSTDGVRCQDLPDLTTPAAGFDFTSGSGTGTLDGTPGASVIFYFSDGGPGGADDRVTLTILEPSPPTFNVVFDGFAAPPGSFPGSTQPTGFNTAQVLR